MALITLPGAGVPPGSSLFDLQPMPPQRYRPPPEPPKVPGVEAVAPPSSSSSSSSSSSGWSGTYGRNGTSSILALGVVIDVLA